MEVHKKIIPSGRLNRPGIANPCEYITIHNTGNYSRGADALAHGDYLMSTVDKTSWHYTVDDKHIVQHLPDGETAYHAGDGIGDGNRKSIGIEICVNSDGDLHAATDKAARLAAELLRRHRLTIERVVQHNKWSGKNCPEELRQGNPYSWEMFLKNVEKHMKNEVMTAERAIDILVERGVITSPEYWKNALSHVKNLDSLFIKMASKLI